MKIGIVGAGMVGSAAAFSLVQQGAAAHIVLVDVNPARAVAEAEDISHAVPFSGATVVQAGDYDDLKGADIVIIAAGVSQKPGESRLALLSRNAAVFGSVVAEVRRAAPGAILLIASNPVDIMGQVAREIADLPPERVIASGTILDTARFRALLGAHLGISPRSIHAYVLGEHGDSEVLCWSSARAGAVGLADFAAQVGAAVTDNVREQIDDGVRRAAYRIIAGKGATWYGIGAGLARIVQAIAGDEQAVLSVSIVTDEVLGVRNVGLSLPRVVGRAGVTATLWPDLDSDERDALGASAQTLRDWLDQLSRATIPNGAPDAP